MVGHSAGPEGHVSVTGHPTDHGTEITSVMPAARLVCATPAKW